MAKIKRTVRAIIIGVIKAYRYLISPFFPSSCRFTPTCSEYALEAVSEHGAVRGAWLSVKRIGRCHPLGSNGFDPVPSQSKTPSPNTDVPELKSH